MTNEELYLEILSLVDANEDIADDMLRPRIEQKIIYFSNLAERTPVERLKRVYIDNIDKLNSYLSSVAPPSIKAFELPQTRNPVGHLIRHTENQKALQFEIHEGKTIIGRKPTGGNSVIAIENDEYVSRNHAIIEVANQQVFISDAGYLDSSKASKNGVFINGNSQRITKKINLQANSTIQIGETKLVYRPIEQFKTVEEQIFEVENTDYVKTVVIGLI